MMTILASAGAVSTGAPASAQVNVCRMSCAGADTINSIKQAGAFQLGQGGPKLVGLVAVISDIHALGQQFAEGVTLTTAYCWDRDDKGRAFARKFERLDAARDGRMAGAPRPPQSGKPTKRTKS